MTVSLTREMQEYVNEKVRTGQFASAEEAVNGLLALFKEQEELTPEDLGTAGGIGSRHCGSRSGRVR